MGWFETDIITNINDVLNVGDQQIRAEVGQREFLLKFINSILTTVGIGIFVLILFILIIPPKK